MNNTIFVKTYAEDVDEKLTRLVSTYHSIVRPLAGLHICTESDSEYEVISCCGPVMGYSPPLTLVSDWLPEAMNITSGYCRQQYVKLSLHKTWRARTERFFVTDSDCHFVGTPELVQLDEVETAINVAPFAKARAYNISALEAAECTKEVLGIDSVAYDYTVYPFWPVDCVVLEALHAYLERLHNKPVWQLFQDLWVEKRALSEMNVYGEFARRNFPHVHRLNDVTKEPVAYHFIRHNHYAPVRLTA